MVNEGCEHGLWISAALRRLQRESGADRWGVWMETTPSEDTGEPCFRGGTVEGSNAHGDSTAWTQIRLAFPLPHAELLAGRSVLQDLTETAAAPQVAGPTLGLRRALWAPILEGATLRGVLFAGSRGATGVLPRPAVEEVAAEIGLALGWEAQTGLARTRKSDLELYARVEARLAGGAEPADLFRELAEDCTRALGAAFAILCERGDRRPVRFPSEASRFESLDTLAFAGDSTWAHGLESGPLETLWRQALDSGQIVGADPGGIPLGRGLGRIVAIPLFQGQRTTGVLLAGLPRSRTMLETLSRLEQRALLAARVLQRKIAKKEQQELETWRQSLLEASPRPIVLLDAAGFVRACSAGARELLSLQEDAGRGVRLAELFRPRHWESISAWIQGSIRHGAPTEDASLQVQRRDGTGVRLKRANLPGSRYLAVELEPMEPSSPRTVADVEEELRQTVGWMGEGVAVFDADGRVRARNEKFLRIFGLSSTEAKELQTQEDFILRIAGSTSQPEEFARRWRELAASAEEETQEELTIEKPFAQTVERCTRLIVGNDGRRLGRVEIYRELNARRQFQSQMARTERLVSLGQQVSGVVHELSNPLTAILGYAQRLERTQPGARGTPAEIRRIISEAERATHILRQLQQLSREASAMRAPVALGDLIDRTADLTRTMLAGSPIRLVVEKRAALPRVEGDFAQLQQVLLNLLQNARQAIEQSGRGSRIGILATAPADTRVRIEVWDDGPGIPGAIQARIFDPFFTTKPPEIGTGLGLAIVLGFVRQHGGTVSVHSPPGGGTRFAVELPALPAAQESLGENTSEPVELAASRLESGTLSGETGANALLPRRPRVLVVEDEPTVGGLIADVLRDEGMRVDVLQDGPSALRRAESERYDLVICDLKMPEMDGQKFFQTLTQREDPLREHVLFVTGDVVTPRTQEFLERHHLPYVAKPFRVEELSHAVHELL